MRRNNRKKPLRPGFVRLADVHDVYVVAGDIFAESYEKCGE